MGTPKKPPNNPEPFPNYLRTFSASALGETHKKTRYKPAFGCSKESVMFMADVRVL
jgi:hypothetical protein